MINLQEFRQLVEEEKSDYSKFDMLVRAGLANKAQLARIHRILDKSNNKQIFQKTRQVVREEINEAELDTADYKIGPSGRKVRAHRFKVGDAPVKEEYEIEEAALDLNNDPPFVLVLKRKSIRLYPNNTKIALYYNQKLDKYFSIPYGGGVDAPVQAEETQIEEGNCCR